MARTEKKTLNPQERQMQEIERRARQGKRRWLLIMLAIMAALVAAAVLVCVFGGMQCAPYAIIFVVIALAITAKLCVGQMGKVMERQRTEKENLDGDGRFSHFQL